MAIKSLLLLVLVLVSGFTEVGAIKRFFNKYASKRVESVTEVMTTSRIVECCLSCMATDGCFAINFKHQSKGNCELTSGLSQVKEMVDDVTSDLYIMDYNLCTEEPGFCLNGATCEQTWTSARCHCTDRYQGDKCGMCGERFQGENCNECADGFFGNQCHIRYTVDFQKDCNREDDIHHTADDANDHEACKIWCANNDACGGFVVALESCWFKDTTCESNVHYNNDVSSDVYLKQIN